MTKQEKRDAWRRRKGLPLLGKVTDEEVAKSEVEPPHRHDSWAPKRHPAFLGRRSPAWARALDGWPDGR